MFSRRTGLDRTPNALAAAVAARRAGGAPLIDLTVSNPTAVGLPLPDLGAALAGVADRVGRHDPWPLGEPEARDALAAELRRLEDRPVETEALALTASTSEAYGALFEVLADPGEAIVAPRPSYPLVEHLARFAGLSVRTFALEDEGGGRYRVEPDDLARAVAGAAGDPPARAVVGVSPNNPTGSYLHGDDLACLASVGLPLVIDEVFRHHPVRAPAPPAPSACDAIGDALVVTLGGLSKHLGLPQAKLAWARAGGPGAEELLARLELVLDARLSVAAATARALPRLLADGPAARAAMGERLRRNAAALHAALDGTCASVETPEGGWTAMVRVPRVHPDEVWAERLLDREGVLVQPGWLYDTDPRRAYLVVGLLTPPAPFDHGVERLVSFLSQEIS